MNGLLMYAGLGTGLFRSVEVALIALYVATVAVIVGMVYGLHDMLHIQGWGIIALVTLLAALGMGKIISKVALDPLKWHFEQLDRFSKETLHELNLPINTITANVSMLRKNQDDEKSLKRLERIEMATVMLKERYNELDYLIKKQMERETLETFDLYELICERIAFLQPLYPDTQWEVSGEACMVTLDRIGFAKVIDNLVDNGVKYSSAPAQIHLQLDQQKLSICDKGKGMDEMTLMRIFDRYYQNDTAMAGYGIGLGLVKRYCDRFRIGLQVFSRLGEGTCITLELNRGTHGK